MVDQVTKKWNDASWWKKFVLVNLIIPWTPLILLMLAFFAPPEVVEAVNESGSLLMSNVAVGWSIVSSFM